MMFVHQHHPPRQHRKLNIPIFPLGVTCDLGQGQGALRTRDHHANPLTKIIRAAKYCLKA
jgi:hypothetical protein